MKKINILFVIIISFSTGYLFSNMKNHIQLRNPIVIVNENNLETTIPIPKTNIDTDKTQWCSPIQEGKDKGKMVCIDPESITTIR